MPKEIKKNLKDKVLNIIGIIICILVLPILILNFTLLIKGIINKKEIPSFGNIVPLIVLSDSMHDDFPAGSAIITKKTKPSEVEVGDIISYYDPASKKNAIVTHKVKFIGNDENNKLIFWTYGTANVNKTFEEIEESDCEKIPESKLIGIYDGFYIKGLGYISVFMQSPKGLIICVFVPFTAIMIVNFFTRSIKAKSDQKDKEALLKELEELRKLKENQEKVNQEEK